MQNLAKVRENTGTPGVCGAFQKKDCFSEIRRVCAAIEKTKERMSLIWSACTDVMDDFIEAQDELEGIRRELILQSFPGGCESRCVPT